MNPKYSRHKSQRMLPQSPLCEISSPITVPASPVSSDMGTGAPLLSGTLSESEFLHGTESDDDCPKDDADSIVHRSIQQQQETASEAMNSSFESSQTADHLVHQSLFSDSVSTSVTTHPEDQAPELDAKPTGGASEPDKDAFRTQANDLATDQHNPGSFPPGAYVPAPWGGSYPVPWPYNPYMFAMPIGAGAATSGSQPYAFWAVRILKSSCWVRSSHSTPQQPGYAMAPYAYAYPPPGVAPDQQVSSVDSANTPAQVNAIPYAPHLEASQRLTHQRNQTSQPNGGPIAENNQFYSNHLPESLQHTLGRSVENRNDGSIASSGDAPQDWPVGQYIPPSTFPAPAPHFPMGFHPYASSPHQMPAVMFPSGWPGHHPTTHNFPPPPSQCLVSQIVPNAPSALGIVNGPRPRAKHGRPHNILPPKPTSRPESATGLGVNLQINQSRMPLRFNPQLLPEDLRRHAPVSTPDVTMPISGVFPRGPFALGAAPTSVEAAQYHHLTGQMQHMRPRHPGVSQPSHTPNPEWGSWTPRSV